ncbi:Neuroligin-4, X-linked [Halotydeus destructor]|nr:Neuroligin-4, X-linked [Halotydeus destructor]
MRPKAVLVLLAIVYSSVITVSSNPSPGSERRQSPRIVTIKYGAVRGSIVTLPNQSLQPVEVFMGIPYASPPVGKLRFMPPVTSSLWTGVKSATTPGPICPQRPPENILNLTEGRSSSQHQQQPLEQYEYHSSSNQSEDCLYLNIFAPSTVAKKSSRMAVLVFVHGELNQWNSGSSYDGSVMASLGNVIVVTINYRLGVLGFFPALDGSARGNFGLMDCVAALHWIQENIGEFGGDEKNVTIFGHGKGASMVNLLMLSPMVKGLFHRAIMSSGSALSPWSMASSAVWYSKKLSQALGCPVHELPSTMSADGSSSSSSSSSASSRARKSLMVNCLRQKSAQELLSVPLDIPTYLIGFGPTVDGIVIPNDAKLLMGESSVLYGTYDLMFGVTRFEGANDHVGHFGQAGQLPTGMDIMRRDRILRTLVRNLFTVHLQEIFHTLVNEYTDWTRSLSNPTHIWESLVELLGDALVVAPTVKSGLLHSKVHAKKSSTFFYQFQYATENAAHKLGCVHGDDLAFVFGAPLVPGHRVGFFGGNYTKTDALVAEKVITYWANFVKFGNPNGDTKATGSETPSTSSSTATRADKLEWPQYDEERQQYLSITSKPRIKDHYHAHRLSYWLNLLPKLHSAGSSSNSEHHLLEDHDNLMTYEGRVRPKQSHSARKMAAGEVALLPMASQHASKNSSSSSLSSLEQSSSEVHIVHSGGGDRKPGDSAFDGDIINTTMSLMMQQGSYSTALSITIAMGCSLFILNLLVFAGIFYKRDRANQQRHHRSKEADDKGQDGVLRMDVQCPSKCPMDTQSLVKLDTYGGSGGGVGCSLYPCSDQGLNFTTGHVATINTAYYGGQDQQHSLLVTLDESGIEKVVTACGTVHFEERDRHDVDI